MSTNNPFIQEAARAWASARNRRAEKITSDLIREREETHGSFHANSAAFDRMLSALPLEAFDRRIRLGVAAIYMKLVRLQCGRGLTEHLEDIEGYAKLMQEMVREPMEEADGQLTTNDC